MPTPQQIAEIDKRLENVKKALIEYNEYYDQVKKHKQKTKKKKPDQIKKKDTEDEPKRCKPCRGPANNVYVYD